MSALVAFSPESAQALKTLLGIDFTEATAFVTSGWALSVAANSAVPKKSKLGRGGTLIKEEIKAELKNEIQE